MADRRGSGRRLVLWLAAAGLVTGLAFVPGRAGAADTASYSATRTLTLLPPSAFNSTDPTDGWVLDGQGGTPWIGVARAQVTKYTSNSGACAPTGYRSLQVVSPSRTSYSLGLVYAIKDGDSLLAQPIPLNDSGVADLSGVHVAANGTLPQFLVVLGGPGEAPATVDVALSWTGLANAACSNVTTPAPTLTVVKHVAGGSATADQWTLHVRNAAGSDVAAGAGSEKGTTYTLPAGTFTVAETGDSSGYTGAFSGDCDATGAVTLADGQSKTCTLTNTLGSSEPPPTLTVIKHVVGGGASAGRWSLHVKDATGAEVTGSPQAGSETGTTYTLGAGTFTVAETGSISGYTGAYSGDCDASGHITLAAGDRKICTLTNTFGSSGTPPTLTVIKHVVGGGASAGRWSLHVKDGTGAEVAGSPQPGAETGTTYTLSAGTFNVAETGDISGYTGAFSGDCDASGHITLVAGDTKTCTLTNTAVGTTGTLTVTKIVSGGTAKPGDWQLHVKVAGAGDVAGSPQAGSSTGTAYTLAPGAYTVSESDGPTGYTASYSGDCNESGAVTVVAGAAKTCTLTNTAPRDTTPPVLHGPGNLIATATSAAGAVVSYDVTATDPDDPTVAATCVSSPSGLGSGSTFPFGVTGIHCTASDPAGNAATPLDFTVTVNDAAPTLSLPADITDTTNDPAGKKETFTATASSFKDGSLPVSCDHPSGSTFPVGKTTVLCSATNSSNQTTAGSFTVTLTYRDVTPPTIQTPGDLTATASSRDGVKVSFDVTATDPDNASAELTVTCGPLHSGDTFPLGKTTITCTAHDPAGNEAQPVSFSVTVTYVDSTPPTLHGPGDLTATATSKDGAAVSFQVTATDPDDAPGTLTVVCDHASGDTFPIKATVVTCNAQDPAGNKAEPLSFTVTVADAAPTLSLPANITDTTNDPAGKTETFSAAASSFKDGSLPVTCDHPSGSTFPVGATTVNCSATNSSNQTTAGSFTVTLTYKDVTPPTIHAPDKVTAVATSSDGAKVTFEVTATDPDNAADALTVTCDHASGETFPIKTTTVTCNAHDPAGNNADPVSFTVTVDDAAPTLSLPANITDTTNDPAGKKETFAATASDFKDGPLSVTCDHLSGETFPVGTTTVHCSATNSSQQTTSGSFTVTLTYVDITPPVLHSPGDKTATATSKDGATVSFAVTATDPDNAGSELTIVCGPLQSGDTFPIGVVTETCNAHDPAGNRAEPISFKVTVDDAPPALSLPADIHDTANDPAGKAETFSATATDFKDGSLTPTCDHASGDVFPVGTTTVHCSVTNSSNMTSSGSFTITIGYQDVTPPELHVPKDITVTATSSAGAVVSYSVTATDPDDAPGAITIVCISNPEGLHSGSTFPIRVTGIHCTASDPAGNAATPLDFTVTVNDAPPFVTVPGNINDTTNNPNGKTETFTVSATDYKDGTLAPTCDHASGATFPVGTTTVTCSATNSSNMTTAESFTVTIGYVDNTPPTIHAPDQVTAIATSSDGAKVSFDVTATDPDDAPDALTVTCDHASGDTFPIKTTTVTCNAHDPAGNNAEPVSFTVTVNDAPPALSLPVDIHDVTHDPAGKAETFSATASDFKDGSLPVTCDHASGDTFPVATTTVHCSATNSSQQTTNGSFAIGIEYVDNTAPTIHAPEKVTAVATSSDGAKVTFEVTATDPDNAVDALTVTCDHASGETFPIKTTTVTCNAHDPAGNNAGPVSFTVTVDDAAPTLSLPDDIHDVTHDPAGTTETFTATASDFKDGVLPVTCDHASGDTFPVGTTTVHCSATNSSQQTTSGSFVIGIEYADNTAPTIHAPESVTAVATSSGGAKVTFDVTATDPDDAAGALTVSCDHASGDTFPIKTTTVTCNAHDAAGNSAQPVSFDVTVNDAPPTLSLPDDIHDVTHNPAGKTEPFSATASDFKDGSLPVTCDHASGDSFPVGTTTVHCSATNSSEQKTSGSFAVTIDYVDTSAPAIHTSGHQHVAATSAAGAAVSYTATADDPDDAAAKLTLACGPLQSGATFPVGVTTITCNASDPAGNHATPATFTVTVDPLPAPPAAPAGTANVSLSVSGPALGRVGADVSFSFVVKSTGNAPTPGVEVRSQVPDGATLVSTTGSATCTGQTSLVCVFGTVPGGATQTQTVILRANRAGSLALFATLSGDGASGSSSASTTVLDVTAPPPAPPTPQQPETFNAISTGTALVNDVVKPSDTLFLIRSGDHVRLTGLLAITTTAGNSGLFSNVPFGTTGGPPTSFVVTINGTATTLTLEGGDFGICTAPRRTAAANPKTVVRQLWGQAKGQFTTKAKYSSATIRGTTWGVQDRCDGTFSIAVDDFVDVLNFNTKKTLTLSPGQTILVTPPRKPSGSFRPPSQSAAAVRSQGLLWAGKRFRTKAQFSAWLSSKGSSWAVFAKQHPALAKALASRRA